MPGNLLAKLPAFKGDEVQLVKNQDIPDIISGVLSRHEKFAAHYDLIAGDFLGGDEYDISKRLFDEVKRSIRYEAEGKERQTVRSPAALIAMADYWGGDCKHYASFIGGVLDAIGRTTGDPIDWVYRFAGYDIMDRTNLGHVFVVINPGTVGEVWVDPVLDGYNQRDPEPWYIKDKRPKTRNMALVEISGLPPAINTMTLARRNRSMMGDPTPPTGGPSITPGTLTNSGGGSTTSSGSGTSSADQAALQAKEAELNAAAPGTGSAVQQAIDTLPNGAIKDFLTSFLANPDKALMSLIFGRQYTSGDYKVGELYMRNILGMEKVQDWEQVPDSYIPQAWAFFSAVMGVRIRTFDDMDALTGTSASPPAVRAANYLQRNPPEVVDISMDAATRAAMILGDETVSKFNMWNHRDEKWTLSIFTSIPYIYPLPGPVELSNFSGVHPILGTMFANGYPTDYTGPRYTTQKSGILQTGVTVVPQGTVPGGTPGVTNLASMLKANPLTFLLVGGGLLFGISQGGKKGSVKGPNKSNMGWYVGGALLLLFLLMKKSATASPPAPITTSPGGPSGPATVTPVSNGGGGTATPIVITPPSGGPGIVIQPPAGGPTVDYPAPINPTLLNNGPLVGPGQVQSNDPGYYLTGGSGTGGGGIINNDTLKPQYLAVDQQQFV